MRVDTRLPPAAGFPPHYLTAATPASHGPVRRRVIFAHPHVHGGALEQNKKNGPRLTRSGE